MGNKYHGKMFFSTKDYLLRTSSDFAFKHHYDKSKKIFEDNNPAWIVLLLTIIRGAFFLGCFILFLFSIGMFIHIMVSFAVSKWILLILIIVIICGIVGWES